MGKKIFSYLPGLNFMPREINCQLKNLAGFGVTPLMLSFLTLILFPDVR